MTAGSPPPGRRSSRPGPRPGWRTPRSGRAGRRRSSKRCCTPRRGAMPASTSCGGGPNPRSPPRPPSRSCRTLMDGHPARGARVEPGWADTLAQVVDGDEKFRGNVWAGVGKALAGLDLAEVRARFDPAPGRELRCTRVSRREGHAVSAGGGRRPGLQVAAMPGRGHHPHRETARRPLPQGPVRPTADPGAGRDRELGAAARVADLRVRVRRVRDRHHRGHPVPGADGPHLGHRRGEGDLGFLHDHRHPRRGHRRGEPPRLRRHRRRTGRDQLDTHPPAAAVGSSAARAIPVAATPSRPAPARCSTPARSAACPRAPC